MIEILLGIGIVIVIILWVVCGYLDWGLRDHGSEREILPHNKHNFPEDFDE